MHIPRLFTDQLIVAGNRIHLSTAASHHLINVLRMAANQPVIVFNGRGGEYSGVVSGVNKKIVSIKITDFHDIDRESPLPVELAVCLIKNDRMDWLLQKAAELGVTSISLLYSKYTDYKIKAVHIAKKLQHWRQVVISACEQSGRTQIPVISPPSALEVWQKTVTTDRRYILHPYSQEKSYENSNEDHNHENHRGNRQLPTDPSAPSSLTLLIGPEGGFTETEFNLSMKNQFSPLILGPRILRTETATLAALALVQCQFGDW